MLWIFENQVSSVVGSLIQVCNNNIAISQYSSPRLVFLCFPVLEVLQPPSCALASSPSLAHFLVAGSIYPHSPSAPRSTQPPPTAPGPKAFPYPTRPSSTISKVIRALSSGITLPYPIPPYRTILPHCAFILDLHASQEKVHTPLYLSSQNGV